MDSEAHRIVLADSRPVVRIGLRIVLEAEPDLVVVGEATTSEEACRLCKQFQPDIMLLTFNLRDASPNAFLTNFCRHHPNTKTIIFTNDLSVRTARESILMGVAGYIHESSPVSNIIQAIRVVLGGGCWYSDSVLNRLVESEKEVAERLDNKSFTIRQREVLHLLATGKTNQEIALSLSISPRTVRQHLYNIRRKLGLGTRTELVIWALESGFSEGVN